MEAHAPRCVDSHLRDPTLPALEYDTDSYNLSGPDTTLGIFSPSKGVYAVQMPARRSISSPRRQTWAQTRG